MDFEYFIENKKVVKASKDVSKAKALVRISLQNLESVSEIQLNDKTASIILVMGYESLRQVLEAMTLLKGYKVFSHEAYTYYLRYLNEIIASEKFDRLRKLRDRINYYGKPVNQEVAENAIKEITVLIKRLRQKYIVL